MPIRFNKLVSQTLQEKNKPPLIYCYECSVQIKSIIKISIHPMCELVKLIQIKNHHIDSMNPIHLVKKVSKEASKKRIVASYVNIVTNKSFAQKYAYAQNNLH